MALLPQGLSHVGNRSLEAEGDGAESVDDGIEDDFTLDWIEGDTGCLPKFDHEAQLLHDELGVVVAHRSKMGSGLRGQEPDGGQKLVLTTTRI